MTVTIGGAAVGPGVCVGTASQAAVAQPLQKPSTGLTPCFGAKVDSTQGISAAWQCVPSPNLSRRKSAAWPRQTDSRNMLRFVVNGLNGEVT